MKHTYPGPLWQEPLAVELHNTIYASGGQARDGIETPDGLRSWLAGIAEWLPEQARAARATRHSEFLALRAAIREALLAVREGKRVPADALESINRAAELAPTSSHAVQRPAGRVEAKTRFHSADPTDVALAALAADAIELLTGSQRENLRACEAPGCVLVFLKDHPRRTWCSEACGNRARQARHYERTRRARRGT